MSIQSENSEFRHLAIGGGLGAALGAWTGSWIVGFLFIIGEGLAHPGITLPDDLAAMLRVAPDRALEATWYFFNLDLLDLPTSPWSLFAGLVVLFSVLGALVASLGRLFSLDAKSFGLSSFAWACRSTVQKSGLIFCLVATALICLVTLTDNYIVLIVAFLLAIFVGAVVVPILICRPKVVAANPAKNWWKPAWPGFWPVAVVLIIAILDFATGFVDDLFATDPGWLSIPISLGLFVFNSLAPLLQSKVLFAAAMSEPWGWTFIFKWRTLGPWIALHLWMVFVASFLIGPVLVIYVWYWKFLPVIATALERMDMILPFSYRALAYGTSWAAESSWFFLMLPIELLVWFATAKLVFELELAQNDATCNPLSLTDQS